MNVIAAHFFAQYLSIAFVTLIILAVMVGFVARLFRK